MGCSPHVELQESNAGKATPGRRGVAANCSTPHYRAASAQWHSEHTLKNRRNGGLVMTTGRLEALLEKKTARLAEAARHISRTGRARQPQDRAVEKLPAEKSNGLGPSAKRFGWKLPVVSLQAASLRWFLAAPEACWNCVSCFPSSRLCSAPPASWPATGPWHHSSAPRRGHSDVLLSPKSYRPKLKCLRG